MKHKWFLILIFLFVIVASIVLFNRPNNNSVLPEIFETNEDEQIDDGGLTEELDPLTIASLKNGEYPGSELVIEQTLPPGSNYERFIASYRSEGLKIYGLLTVPNGVKP